MRDFAVQIPFAVRPPADKSRSQFPDRIVTIVTASGDFVYPLRQRFPSISSQATRNAPKMQDSRCDLLHQILNELTVVQGECELMEDGKSAKASRRLKVIQASVRRMTNLILNTSCPPTREATARDRDSRWLFRESQGPNEQV